MTLVMANCYFDTSALINLYIEEEGTAKVSYWRNQCSEEEMSWGEAFLACLR